MNLNIIRNRISSDDSVNMSEYKIQSSSKQSTIKYSNSKSSSSDESLTDMIKKKRQQINKKVYGKEVQKQQQEIDDATFDLSDTYNDSAKFKIGNESTLESRIKKLEKELNTSVKSTLQRNYQHNQSASLTSVDSFSIDMNQFQQGDLNVNYYNNRLESLRSKNQEPAIEWKKGRKIEEFDFEILNLQQELEQLKDNLNKEESEYNKQKLKLKTQLKKYTQQNTEEDEQEYNERVYDLPMQQNQYKSKKIVASSSKKSSHHSPSDQNQNLVQNTKFKKKSRTEIEVIDELSQQNSKNICNQDDQDDDSDKLSENEIQEIPKQHQKSHASKKQTSVQNLPNSNLEFKEKNGNDVSIDVVPQKHKSNSQLTQNLTENQFPNTLILPSKASLQCDVSRLYKLNKEVEVLQQIEKIREKLKKSINKKMNSEKVVERYDPSFTMPSKSKIMNKSGKLHCPNCTYLLNKGMSTAYCHCNK